MLGYAGSDLVCYRAEGPEALTAAQARQWDPLVAFAGKKLKAPLHPCPWSRACEAAADFA